MSFELHTIPTSCTLSNNWHLFWHLWFVLCLYKCDLYYWHKCFDTHNSPTAPWKDSSIRLLCFEHQDNWQWWSWCSKQSNLILELTQAFKYTMNYSTIPQPDHECMCFPQQCYSSHMEYFTRQTLLRLKALRWRPIQYPTQILSMFSLLCYRFVFVYGGKHIMKLLYLEYFDVKSTLH